MHSQFALYIVHWICFQIKLKQSLSSAFNTSCLVHRERSAGLWSQCRNFQYLYNHSTFTLKVMMQLSYESNFFLIRWGSCQREMTANKSSKTAPRSGAAKDSQENSDRWESWWWVSSFCPLFVLFQLFTGSYCLWPLW